MADMFKNQLQELAQRSCFNLPSYACIREGPDHAPRFKASVNFNGEIFESPSYCPTLRQAEHSAAEAALNILSIRGPSRSLTARVIDETGVYKNLLQETAHRAGLKLPVYTTVRSGPGHLPIFTCTVELAGMSFTGEPAKNKKQAEKNAAIAAWSALKTMPNLDSLTKKEGESHEEQDQAVVSRVLSSFKSKDDSKQFRRRDYNNNNQAKRRMVNGVHYSDIISFPPSSSSTSSKSLIHQKRMLMDLLMDSSSSTQKSRNSSVSLLPPPPPRTASKILPQTSYRDSSYNLSCNRPNSIRIRGKSKDDEWHSAKRVNKCIEKEGSSSRNLVSNSNVYGASTSSRGTEKHNMLDIATRTEASELIRRIFGSQNSSQMASTMARNMYTGGFNPQRIATAVKMRSVIPVCAAPPLAPKRPDELVCTPTSTCLNIAGSSSSHSMQIGTARAEVSSSSSSVMFDKSSQPNSDSDQLNSKLKNLQLTK